MLIKYIQAAMRGAQYEMLEDDHSFQGSIPGLQGVWAYLVFASLCDMICGAVKVTPQGRN